MQYRPFGPNKEMVSIVALGGIVIRDRPQKEATQIIHKAFDCGVNYFDVAPTYGDPEILLGPALSELPRDKFFLSCKTGKRNKKEAQAELEQSLKRLQVDHLDLYQFHAVKTMEQVDEILAPGGAMEVFIEAKEKGLVHHLGMSIHEEDPGIRLLDAGDFSSVLFPLNWRSMLKNGFGKKIIDKCKQSDITALALKAMARTKKDEHQKNIYNHLWYQPELDKKILELGLRYTLSQDITMAIPPGELDLFFEAVKIAENFSPITEEEIDFLKTKMEEVPPLFPVIS